MALHAMLCADGGAVELNMNQVKAVFPRGSAADQ